MKEIFINKIKMFSTFLQFKIITNWSQIMSEICHKIFMTVYGRFLE